MSEMIRKDSANGYRKLPESLRLAQRVRPVELTEPLLIPSTGAIRDGVRGTESSGSAANRSAVDRDALTQGGCGL